MLATSLRHLGAEYVARPEPLAAAGAGAMTAIALMHPWANRLGGRRYRAAGRRVDLGGLALPTDEHGLPLHGNLTGAPFAVDALRADRIVAHRIHAADDDRARFAAFPYPHRLEVRARLDGRRGLTVTTTVRPTSGRPVPVAFGWHPYLRLPSGSRSGWELVLPRREHIALDPRRLPTGVRTPERATRVALSGLALDDHFALAGRRAIALGNGTHRVTVGFGSGFPFVQIYAPARRRFVAIEPMTAPIDGLRHGRVPVVTPGHRFATSFTIAVGAD
ncbi:MAG: aldose 1-epimerase [Actinomycetota bacterium]